MKITFLTEMHEDVEVIYVNCIYYFVAPDFLRLCLEDDSLGISVPRLIPVSFFFLNFGPLYFQKKNYISLSF